jgi:superoxide dismutase, Fe-Mn family
VEYNEKKRDIMTEFEKYVQDLRKWKEEMKTFLQVENVHQEDVIWNQLHHFSEILNESDRSLEYDDLLEYYKVADSVYKEMEIFINHRRQLGTIEIVNNGKVEAGAHKLPQLPYPYNALEPYISEEIMRLHHDKHHRAYVDGLNKAEKKLVEARKNHDFSLIKHWSRELAFHGSGHYLHTIFWNNMKPNGGGRPSGNLLKEINQYFGSLDDFKRQFTEAAKQVEGVGWAILVWSPRSHHLEILQSERHMLLTQWDTIPLLVLDVWEHAYYLQYKTERAEYIKNWWNIVNWNNVEERFEKASVLRWQPF